MSRIEWIGLPLSALAVGVFVWLLLDWLRRRRSFPALQYGGTIIEPRMVSWLWLLVLVGSLFLSRGTLLRTTSTEMPALGDFAAIAQGGERSSAVVSSRSWHVTLPFYRYERSSEQLAGDIAIVSTTRALLLPFWLIIGLLVYWRFAMRDPIRAEVPE